ncbi:MAG: hypothetical protein KKB21_02230 [Nanoarchaeota archaeon]|nr:hypothetical protein [Nanoarchaeota archaeon]MBU4086373.1 hypothetical protein [Nanoarchaeota archaeon]
MGIKKTLANIVLAGAMALGVVGSCTSNSTEPGISHSQNLPVDRTKPKKDISSLIDVLDPNYELSVLAENLGFISCLAVSPSDGRIYFIQQKEKDWEKQWDIYELVNGKAEKRFDGGGGASQSKTFGPSCKISINSQNQLFVFEQFGEMVETKSNIKLYDLKSRKLRYKADNLVNLTNLRNLIVNPLTDNFLFTVYQLPSGVNHLRTYQFDTKTNEISLFRNLGDFADGDGDWIKFFGLCFDENNSLHEVWSKHITKTCLTDNNKEEVKFKDDIWDFFIQNYTQYNARVAGIESSSKKVILYGAVEGLMFITEGRGLEPRVKTGDYIMAIDPRSGGISGIAKSLFSPHTIRSVCIDKNREMYLSVSTPSSFDEKMDGKIVKLSKKK